MGYGIMYSNSFTKRLQKKEKKNGSEKRAARKTSAQPITRMEESITRVVVDCVQDTPLSVLRPVALCSPSLVPAPVFYGRRKQRRTSENRVFPINPTGLVNDKAKSLNRATLEDSDSMTITTPIVRLWYAAVAGRLDGSIRMTMASAARAALLLLFRCPTALQHHRTVALQNCSW